MRAFLAAALLLAAAPARADDINAELRAGAAAADAEILKQGMVFRTNQDRVNYMLCKKGHKAVCSRIRYERAPGFAPLDPNSGVTPKKKKKKEEAAPSGESAGGGEAEEGSEDKAAGGAKEGEKEAGEKASGATNSQAAAASASGAMKNASAMGEKLKAQMTDSTPDAPGAGAGGPEPAPKSGAAASAVALSAEAPAARSAEFDLTVAAASGYSASFSAVGLKMGSGSSAGRIVREDGTPAQPEDVQRLRDRIASDPQALMRRPDFFDVVGRSEFEGLKTSLRSKPGAAALKHVGLSGDERDILFKQSCTKLDRSCNPKAKVPYRKGEFVSPEDLRAIDEALADEEEQEEASGTAASAGPAAAAERTARAQRRAERRARAATQAQGKGQARPDKRSMTQAALYAAGKPSFGAAQEPASERMPLWPVAAAAGLIALWFLRRR